MRLLVDEALSRRVAHLLQAAGHDAVHVGDLALLGEPDDRIMSATTSEDRILVSADTDFGELLALGRHRKPSVILVRRAPHKPEQQAAMIISSLRDLEGPLATGAIAVIVGDRIRVRALPIDQ